jgi:endonuclease-3
MARAASRRSKPTVSRRTAFRGTAPRPSARRPSTPGKPRPNAASRPAVRRAPAKLDPAAVSALFDKLAQAIPDPKSELRYASPFELLVSVILSAQATDKSVNLATGRLFPGANTPQAILALGEAGLLEYVRTIGLAPTKTRNIIATCRLLLERHGGKVPATREALEALPGVGRKTANVVLNTAFGQPTLAVDTHVFRVANRTGLARGKTPLQVEEGLLAVVPPRHLKHAHHLLILHGRYTCTARQPACPACVIRAECAWPEKTEG